MKCEVSVYIKRLLSIAKSKPGIVFILCVYTFTSAAVYMNIEDHKRDSNENQCENDNTLNYWETLFFFVAMITTIGMYIYAIYFNLIYRRVLSFPR